MSSNFVNLISQTVDITLDTDTAHRRLEVSKDGKSVRFTERRGEKKVDLDSSKRFDTMFFVLAKDGYNSGKHCWVVKLNQGWRVGVMRESAKRKGKFTICPQQGYWCLDNWCQNEYCFSVSALADQVKHLPEISEPKQLLVCVDVDERWVTFYDAVSRSHIYTFTGMVFGEGEKLYPVFRTVDYNATLSI